MSMSPLRRTSSSSTEPRNISIQRGWAGLPMMILVTLWLVAKSRMSSAVDRSPCSTAVSAPSRSARRRFSSSCVALLVGVADVLAGLHVGGDPGRLQGFRQAPGGPDQAGRAGLGIDADQHPLARGPGLAGDALAGHVAAHVGVHVVGGAAQGQFAQGQQVALAEEALDGVLGLLGHVDLALLQALQQLLGRDVHQLDLVGALEQGVGDVLPHHHAGDLRHGVLEALQVLHVDRGEHVDAGVQQVDHVLPALHVQGALDVGVGQLVHEDERGLALERRLQVELLQLHAPVGQQALGQHRRSLR